MKNIKLSILIWIILWLLTHNFILFVTESRLSFFVNVQHFIKNNGWRWVSFSHYVFFNTILPSDSNNIYLHHQHFVRPKLKSLFISNEMNLVHLSVNVARVEDGLLHGLLMRKRKVAFVDNFHDRMQITPKVYVVHLKFALVCFFEFFQTSIINRSERLIDWLANVCKGWTGTIWKVHIIQSHNTLCYNLHTPSIRIYPSHTIIFAFDLLKPIPTRSKMHRKGKKCICPECVRIINKLFTNINIPARLTQNNTFCFSTLETLTTRKHTRIINQPICAYE